MRINLLIEALIESSRKVQIQIVQKPQPQHMTYFVVLVPLSIAKMRKIFCFC